MGLVNGDCDAVRVSLGAYALGALETSEEAVVRAHLEGCAGCRAELAAIAGLPRVLGRLEEFEVAAMDGAEGRIVERAWAELVRRRRGLRFRRGLAAALGALAVAVVAAASAAVVTSRAGTPTPPVGAVHLAGSNSGMGIAASADGYTESWGTSIHLVVSGVPAGDTCELLAVDQSGEAQVAGSWRVGYTGKVDVDGAVGMDPDQIATLQVVASTGAVLVTLT